MGKDDTPQVDQVTLQEYFFLNTGCMDVSSFISDI